MWPCRRHGMRAHTCYSPIPMMPSIQWPSVAVGRGVQVPTAFHASVLATSLAVALQGAAALSTALVALPKWSACCPPKVLCVLADAPGMGRRCGDTYVARAMHPAVGSHHVLMYATPSSTLAPKWAGPAPSTTIGCTARKHSPRNRCPLFALCCFIPSHEPPPACAALCFGSPSPAILGPAGSSARSAARETSHSRIAVLLPWSSTGMRTSGKTHVPTCTGGHSRTRNCSHACAADNNPDRDLNMQGSTMQHAVEVRHCEETTQQCGGNAATPTHQRHTVDP